VISIGVSSPQVLGQLTNKKCQNW